jgi:glutamate formiminotransferase/formiminotetrahydrofolate cyclodeaminase
MSFSSLPLHDFLRALASAQPTPGGGTAAAIGGAMGASLLMMVSALPRTRGNTDDERATLATVRARLEPLGNALEECADRDAEAYDAVMAAYRLPKASDEEKAARRAAITSAMKGATEAPLETLRRTVEGLEAAEMVAALGNPSASSDVGVGVGLLAAAAQGAAANVRINLDGLADDAFKASASSEMEALLKRAEAAQALARAVQA